MKLENEKDDIEKGEEEAPFLEMLQEKQSRLEHDARLNSKLRKAMRQEKKELKRKEDQRSFVEKNMGKSLGGSREFRVSEGERRLLELKKFRGSYEQNS